MNAKQFLSQAFNLTRLIKSYEKELEELKALEPYISSPNYSGMPFSGTRNPEPPFVRAIHKKVNLESKIEKKVKDLIDVRVQIHDAIEAVSDDTHRLVLRLRYIDFLSWEEIASEMNYSEVHIHRLHNAALNFVTVPET